jgi:NMD protein affecting ribosome stability and mRNA decay
MADGPGAAPAHAKEREMAACNRCGDEAEELFKVKLDGRTKKLCQDCIDVVKDDAAIAEESEAVVQNMMGFKGRR